MIEVIVVLAYETHPHQLNISLNTQQEDMLGGGDTITHSMLRQ